jgi:YegS/Rv2252/BmrU family lipid kinase
LQEQIDRASGCFDPISVKVLIILNRVSRKKELFTSQIHPPLKARFNPEIRETQYAGHAESLAAEGIRDGFDVILSAGGDGTMHQVVNGIMAQDKALPTVGLIPLGSGNDLARSLGISTDVTRIISQIERRSVRDVDVGIANVHDGSGNPVTRYFINECSMGMGPEVVRRVNKTSHRGMAAGLMYTSAIIATFLRLRPEKISVKSDGFRWSGKSRVMAIANGRSFGHGNYIAPRAKMDDGLLDVFVAGNPPLLRFLLLLQALKRPRESRNKYLSYSQTVRAEVFGDRPLPVEADGEPIGFSPLRCGIAKTKLKVLL